MEDPILHAVRMRMGRADDALYACAAFARGIRATLAVFTDEY